MKRRVYDVIAIAKWLALIAVAAMLLWGCGARVQPSPAVPGAPGKGAPGRSGTPLENALAYNASLASSNLAVAHLVINANNQSPPLVPVDSANKILTAQSRVADLDRQLTPLLADASTIAASSPQIRQLIAEIFGAASALVGNSEQGGDLGIKDANTQQAVLGAMNGVKSYADQLLRALESGGLLK
jgi:hypothetical protein